MYFFPKKKKGREKQKKFLFFLYFFSKTFTKILKKNKEKTKNEKSIF
jgi:hypothetical protein